MSLEYKGKPKPRLRDSVKILDKHETFCQLYINGDKELFGNGIQCYVEVFDVDQSKGNWYRNASASASRLLKKPAIIKRIQTLLEDGGWNDTNITKQHLFLINQHADLGVKMKAINSYNELKGKLPEDPKIGTTNNFFINVTDSDKKRINKFIDVLDIRLPQKNGRKENSKKDTVATLRE